MALHYNSLLNLKTVATSKLTKLQRQTKQSATIDLGLGYPDIISPNWLNILVNECTSKELLQKYAELSSIDSLDFSFEKFTHELLVASCNCLGISPINANNGFVCYSGSHALERVIASQVPSESTAIITNPSIDIVNAILIEKGVRVKYILSLIHI